MYIYNSTDSSGYIGKKIGYFRDGRLVPIFSSSESFESKNSQKIFNSNLSHSLPDTHSKIYNNDIHNNDYTDTNRNPYQSLDQNSNSQVLDHNAIQQYTQERSAKIKELIKDGYNASPSYQAGSKTIQNLGTSKEFEDIYDSKKYNKKYETTGSKNTENKNLENLSISQKDRTRHLYVVGKTGMGKSTLLENLVIQDIYAGLGVCFIDPHGDSVEYILDKIPASRHKDVIYFNPSDLEYPIGLNMLDGEEVEDYLVCSGMMSVFKRIWAGSWSSRMEYILNNTLLTLLEMHNGGFDKNISGQASYFDSEGDYAHDFGEVDDNTRPKKDYSRLSSKNIQNWIKTQTYQKRHGAENLENISETGLEDYPSNLNQHAASQVRSGQAQTLLGVIKILSNSEYLKSIIPSIKNPILKHFWEKEYLNFNEKYRQEATSPILNKIGQFFSSSVIRGIVGQSTSSFDFRQVMDESQILLVNLNKGKLGEDNTNILGSLIVTKIQIATMNRNKRTPFNLYVDEFQNFTTDSFASILSEARKYGLCLNLANQYVDQLSETGNQKIKNAIFGNIGSLIVFQVGYHDVQPLSLELGVQPDALTNLQRGLFVARISNMEGKNNTQNAQQNPYQGSSGEVVLGQSFGRVFSKFGGNSEIVRELSRQKYGRDRLDTEKNIEQYLITSSQKSPDNKKSNSKNNKKKKGLLRPGNSQN